MILPIARFFPSSYRIERKRETLPKTSLAAPISSDSRGSVSVFVYPDYPSEISEIAPLYRLGNRKAMIQQVRGYTTARWQAHGLVYAVVTDLPETDATRLFYMVSDR